MPRFCSAGLGVVLLAASGTAQPPPVTGRPAVPVLLDYVGDPTLTVELGLTAEQVKKLTEYRKEVWDEAYSTRPLELTKTAATRAKATEVVLKTVLTPAQFERAKRLATRQILVNAWHPYDVPSYTRVPARGLIDFPDIVEALNLSEDQRALLKIKTNGAGHSIYPMIPLSEDQIASLERRIGPLPDKRFVAVQDPRMTGKFSAPAELDLLVVPDVQHELRLTEEQLKTIFLQSEKWRNLAKRDGMISRQELDNERIKLEDALDRDLGQTLTQEQATRTFQILLQRLDTTTPKVGIYLDPRVARSLALTDPQKEQLNRIVREFRDEFESLSSRNITPAEVRKRLDAYRVIADKSATDVLTEQQIAKFRSLHGEPYKRRSNGNAIRNIPESALDLRRNSFGKYTTELAQLARNTDVQADLKLSPEQIQKTIAAEKDVPEKRVPGSTKEQDMKLSDDRSKFVAAAISDILTVNEQKRFRQIMLQVHERHTQKFTTPGVLIGSAAAYPGVAEEIRLSPEQKQRLIDTDQAWAILSDEQKDLIKTMLGAEYRGRTAPPSIPPPAVPKKPVVVPPLLRLGPDLARGRFDVALKLTTAQQVKLTIAYVDFQTAGISDEEPDRNLAFIHGIEQILTPEQKKRLGEM